MESNDSPIHTPSRNLSILSARLYDDGAAIRAASQARSLSQPDLYRGGSQVQDNIISTESHTGNELPTTESEFLQQRNRRGRPRIETVDETEEDRRKTRRRLSKRAYRDRKQDALSYLERRERMLLDTVETMNELFLNYRAAIGRNDQENIADRMAQVYQASKNWDSRAEKQSEKSSELESPTRENSTEDHMEVWPLARRRSGPDHFNYNPLGDFFSPFEP
jgi:hypothetical protein